jgi:hypothetical protein
MSRECRIKKRCAIYKHAAIQTISKAGYDSKVK